MHIKGQSRFQATLFPERLDELITEDNPVRVIDAFIDALEDIPEEMIHTIPVRLEPCDVPEPFTTLHWCDLFEAEGFDRLAGAIEFGLKQRAAGPLLPGP